MNKQQQDSYIKEQFQKLADNMCVVCIHNATCQLPLHGAFSMQGEPCSHAEPLPPKEMMLWSLKNLYGLPTNKEETHE